MEGLRLAVGGPGALPGERCQRCAASARPTAPARVGSFLAQTRSALRRRQMPLRGGSVKGALGEGVSSGHAWADAAPRGGHGRARGGVETVLQGQWEEEWLRSSRCMRRSCRCPNAVLSADLQVGETCSPSSVPLPSGGFKSYIKSVRWRSPGQLLGCAALLLTRFNLGSRPSITR